MPTAFDASVKATTRVRVVDQPLELVEVEIEAGLDDADLVHDEAAILRDEQPWRDVRVVVEPGRDDLVARLERARDRVRQQEVERRHVRAERDLVRVAADEVGDRGATGLDHLVRGRLARNAPPRFALSRSR